MTHTRLCKALLALALASTELLGGCGGGAGSGDGAAEGTVLLTFKWPTEVSGRLITVDTDQILVRCTHPDHAAQIVAATKAEVGTDGALRKTIALPVGIWRFQAFGFTNLGALEVYGSTQARVLADATVSVGLTPQRPLRSDTLTWAMLPDAGTIVFYADQGTSRKVLLQSLSNPPAPPTPLQAADPPLTWTLTPIATDGGTDWLALSATTVTAARAEVQIDIDRSRLPFLVNVAILRIDAGAGGMRELAIVVTSGNAPAVATPDPALVGEWSLQQVTRNGVATATPAHRLSIGTDLTWRREDLGSGDYWSGVLQVLSVQAGATPGTYQFLVLDSSVAESAGGVRLGTYTSSATQLSLTEIDAGDEWVETFGR